LSDQTTNDDSAPTPPMPSPDDALLGLVIKVAVQQLREEGIEPENAIVWAAVHGWMEGHIEGHDCKDEQCLTWTDSRSTSLLIDTFRELDKGTETTDR
jgi:hypothetical protein